MSKTRILLMEAGVVLDQVIHESGQTIVAKVYSVSTLFQQKEYLKFGSQEI